MMTHRLRRCPWALAFLLLGTSCNREDCSTEKCSSGVEYQSCVDGDDFVVKTPSGDEIARCTTDYEEVGGVKGRDRNDCSLKQAQAKHDYCASHGSDSPSGSSGSSGNGSSGSNGNGNPTGGGKAYCAKSKDNGTCNCQNTDFDPGADRVKVSSCSAAVGLVKPICCAYSDSAGATLCTCTSEPRACREKGTSCSCPETAGFDNTTRGSPTEVVASCGKTDGRICCQSDSYCTCGREQYAGAGCVGFGGVNESATPVASCTAPAKPVQVCQGDPELASCDGLEWAP